MPRLWHRHHYRGYSTFLIPLCGCPTGSSGLANTGPFSMSVARRFEFVIGPFLIIDLAKTLLARPILTPALSPEDQCSEPVASNNGRLGVSK
jgi:hypothetical protein